MRQSPKATIIPSRGQSMAPLIKQGSKLLVDLESKNYYHSLDGWFLSQKIFGRVVKIIYPEYTIDLNSPKNKILKYFFVLYSRLNLRFPFLLNLRKLYKISFLKTLYRFLIKS